MSRKFWPLRVLRFVLFAALFVAVISYVTMRLWNWLLPDLFHLPAISWLQALGLLALSRLLFGLKGGGGKPGWARHAQWKRHMAARLGSLSTEEKEKFRQQMRARCAGAGWGRRRPEAAEAAVE